MLLEIPVDLRARVQGFKYYRSLLASRKGSAGKILSLIEGCSEREYHCANVCVFRGIAE